MPRSRAPRRRGGTAEDRAVAEPWGPPVASLVSAGFLRAYLKKADGASSFLERTPTVDAARRVTFGKAFHELSGELAKKSDRILIPLHGLAALLGSSRVAGTSRWMDEE